MSELKDCPFCGNLMDATDGDTVYPSGTFWRERGDGYRQYIGRKQKLRTDTACYKITCRCGAKMHGDSRSEAIQQWNTRT